MKKLVNGEDVEMTADEEAARQAEIDAWEAQQPRLAIIAQIAELERQQTPRRIREFLEGTDTGWLTDLNKQIVALRAQLK